MLEDVVVVKKVELLYCDASKKLEIDRKRAETRLSLGQWRDTRRDLSKCSYFDFVV